MTPLTRNMLLASRPRRLDDADDVVQANPPAHGELWTYDYALGVWTNKTPKAAGLATARGHEWYYKDPQGGKEYIAARLPVAATITRIDHITAGTGSSLVFNVEIRAWNAPGATGTKVWTSDKTANTTGTAETSFDNASVAAHRILVVTIVSLGGTVPDAVWIGIELEDD